MCGMFNVLMRLNYYNSFIKFCFNDIFCMIYKGINEWKRKVCRKVLLMKCYNVVIVII